MGSNGSNKKPEYPTTIASTGLFGSSLTTPLGSIYQPSNFQKQLTGFSEKNALSSLERYLNPDYESEDYKRGDEYYTNKMNTMLENNYLNPALQKNLLRGSTAADIMRGFASDLANTEYERQNNYRDQQYQNYIASMLPYSTAYDTSMGVMGLSQALANSIADYNSSKSKSSGSGSAASGIGSLLGGMGSLAQGIGSMKGTK